MFFDGKQLCESKTVIEGGEQIMIKVLSNKTGSSPFSRKGLIVLEEKGLPYEQINTDPEFLPEGFGDVNPNLRTSVIIDWR